MRDRLAVLAGLALLVGGFSSPLWLSSPGLPDDIEARLELPRDKTPCIEPRDAMRRDHVAILLRWRDEVVREGLEYDRTSDGREVRMSLQGTCLRCHSAPSRFCDRCHAYVGVSPDCWTCHVRPPEHP